MKRTLFTSLLFAFVAFLQTSFFVHFAVFGIIPNIFLLSFFLFLVLGRSDFLSWFFPALAGGFIFDMYSDSFIGFWPALLLAFGFLVQGIKERYVLLPRLAP